jgi:O-antigen/teichoic acid export membrane protein
VLLGAIGNPALVALYTVTRTVSRMGMSAASMLIFSFTPEYSFAWGRNDAASFKALLRKQATFLAVLSSVYVIAVWWFIPWGVQLLSHGSIAPLAAFSMTMALAVFFEMLWTAAFSPLSAVNQHAAVSRIFLIAAVAAIAFAAFFKSPILIAASVALAHAATLLFSLRDLGKLRVQLKVMPERSLTTI